MQYNSLKDNISENVRQLHEGEYCWNQDNSKKTAQAAALKSPTRLKSFFINILNIF